MRVLTPFLKIPTNGFRIFGVLVIGLFSLILAANSLIQGYSQTREPTQSAVGILSFNGKLRIDGNVAWGTHGQSELPIIYNGTSIYLQNGTATLELLMGGSIELCEESNLTVQEIHSPYLFTLQHGSIIFDLPNSAGDIFFTPDFLIKIKPNSDSRTHYKGKIQVDQDGTICITSEKGPLVVETQDQSSMFDISAGSGITIRPGETPSFRGPENCVCKNTIQSIDSEKLSSAVQNSGKFSQKGKVIPFLRKLLKILTFGIV